jgi:hypothetical protein
MGFNMFYWDFHGISHSRSKHHGKMMFFWDLMVILWLEMLVITGYKRL